MALTHQFFTTPSTAPLLSELHKNCFNEPWSEQAFDDLLKLQGTVAHLILQDKNPIGFTLYQSILDEAEILTLGVLPKFQDQKIGEKMLRSGISHLHDIGVNRIFLEVSEDNKAAQRLYEKLEFLTVGRRANYYKIGGLATDALILEYKHK